MADFATDADVIVLFGALSEAQAPRVERWLGFASRLVRQAFPTVDARIDAGTLDPDLVRDIVAEAVVRGLRNPLGAKSETETIGPKSHSVTFDDRTSAGFVYLTAQELAWLAPAAINTLGIGTINVRPGM